MKNLLRYTFLLLAIVAIVGCNTQDNHTADGTTYTCPMHPQIVQDAPGTCPICFMDLVPVSQTGAKEGELMLSDSQIKLGNITTRRVKTGQTGGNTLLTGRLAVDETQTDVISSRAPGRIEKLYIKQTGVQVRLGQPLYQLYSEQLLTLQQEYVLALQQQRELGQQEARFSSFADAAKQKLKLYGLTEGQLQQLARTGKVQRTITFVSPASGIITEVAAAEGMYVNEGSTLYRTTGLGKLWAEAELYPQEAANIKQGDPVSIAVQGFEQPVQAKVTFINPELRLGSQVVMLRADIPNPDRQLIPGMQATITLPRSATEDVLTLPTDAIIRDERGSHVWVQSGKNTFKARMVTTGEASSDQVAILSGLKENDKVVITGAYLLYSEFVLKKGADPMAGHQH